MFSFNHSHSFCFFHLLLCCNICYVYCFFKFWKFKLVLIFSIIPSDVPKISKLSGLYFLKAFLISSAFSWFKNNAPFTVSILVGAFLAETPAITSLSLIKVHHLLYTLYYTHLPPSAPCNSFLFQMVLQMHILLFLIQYIYQLTYYYLV